MVVLNGASIGASCLVAGGAVVLLGAGGALYIGAGFGAGPRDAPPGGVDSHRLETARPEVDADGQHATAHAPPR